MATNLKTIRNQAEKRAGAVTTEVTERAQALTAEATKRASDLTPVYAVVGLTDTVVERARELNGDVEVVELSADHFFVGQHDTVADVVGEFLVDRLR